MIVYLAYFRNLFIFFFILNLGAGIIGRFNHLMSFTEWLNMWLHAIFGSVSGVSILIFVLIVNAFFTRATTCCD